MRARERYDVCAAERPEGSTIASLRPMMEQDVDLSAVSAVVDVSSADGRQQCRSNGWQRTLEYGPLNPAGSGREPSGIKQENQQSVARCNLRNQANRLSRPCVELERAVILHRAVEGMANNGAWPATVSYPARTIFLCHR